MTVDELDKQLMRPTYNLRMGRALHDDKRRSLGLRKGGKTKAQKARLEIDVIVKQYAREAGWLDTR